MKPSVSYEQTPANWSFQKITKHGKVGLFKIN